MVSLTYNKDGQLCAVKQNVAEYICVETEDGHRQDELDDTNGDEALGCLGEMLTALWPDGRIFALAHLRVVFDPVVAFRNLSKGSPCWSKVLKNRVV